MLLTTDRLQLREFEPADWRDIMRYQCDPEFLRFYHWNERTPADVQSFLGTMINWQYEHPRTRFQLAIVLREENRLIGNIGIRQRESGAQEAEMGYELDRAYWGHGYATEAGQAMLRFAFAQLALH